MQKIEESEANIIGKIKLGYKGISLVWILLVKAPNHVGAYELWLLY